MEKIGLYIKAIFLLFFAGISGAFAQNGTQSIRGIIIDKSNELPLAAATIAINSAKIGSVSDEKGQFVLKGIVPGRHQIEISCKGFKTVVIPEILVTAGKEVVLEIGMEEEIVQLTEVVVKANNRKGMAKNSYATVSAHSFDPEQVQRFSGGRNDPSKLVANYAGVVSGNDSRNDIIVRGNSPTGVLWRIEGLPAPNPNHFATLGTTGGPVTLLNTNALKTSDFLTGAFPSEFGNATAAVFDINLRTGNNQHHEKTFQMNAFSGLELTLEGPLGQSKKGASYLLGYRYSFTGLAKSIGLNIGTGATPKYQDWVFNIDFGNLGKHRINFYGIGGTSKIDFLATETDSTDFYSREDQDAYSRTNLFIAGLKHTWEISKKVFVRNHFSFSSSKDDYDAYQYSGKVPPAVDRWLITESRNQTNTFRYHSFINVKQNAKLSYRLGVQAETNGLQTKVIDREGKPATALFDMVRNYDSRFTLMQAYAQSKYKPFSALTLLGGVNFMHFTFNKTSLVAPRLAAIYQLSKNSIIQLAYGLHGQTQPLPVYLYENLASNGQLDFSNRNLDFTRANHWILGYEIRPAKQWRVKTELYLQVLKDVPVESVASGYSVLNEGGGFAFTQMGGLVNNGKGTNKGVEFTIERFLSGGWYLLSSFSLFNASYKGSDEISRNSTFNYKRVTNFLAGREWGIGAAKRNAITFDIRLCSIGGGYQTPVDLAASKAAGKEVLDVSKYNATRLDGYFRLDGKIGFRINSSKKKFSQTFYFDIQNITNRQNIFLERYNPLKQTVGKVYQLGFFPDFMYKIQF